MNVQFSKLIFFVVLVVWVLTTALVFICGIYGVESGMIEFGYKIVNAAFMYQVTNYTVKSGFENVAKIKQNNKSKDD